VPCPAESYGEQAGLGPYEIVAPLGAGGMGEVWKAKDSRLDRFVAVKVLPDHLAEQPEALARFEREAKAVAALNHPNILAIHDFTLHGDTAFVVMELLEGESLRERLQRGPIEFRKATELAIQIAQGLAAAHEKGIVHRDLKPDNLWVTHDGRLKILDFGLAKLTTAIRTTSNALQSTDALSPGYQTEGGVILGTLRYMSPEQVRGETVDARSDIFSFGVVWFEMLTGRKAFARDTAADTMAAILKEEPLELGSEHAPVPPMLKRVLDHCLEKRPARRFHDAMDLAFALESFQGGSSEPFVGQPEKRRPPWIRGAIFAGLGMGLLALLLISLPARTQPTFQRLTFGKGTVGAARFVHGSHEVVYSARWNGADPELFELNPESLEPRARGIKKASLVSISPTGELAVKRNPRLFGGLELGQLVLVSPGGAERIELEEILDGDWLPDGSGLVMVYADTQDAGKATIEFKPGQTAQSLGKQTWSARVSPKGDTLAVFEQPTYAYGDGRIVVVDRQGIRKTLAELKGFTGMAWGPGGKEIWYSIYGNGSSAIWGLSLQGRKRLLLRQAGLLELQDVSPEGRTLASLAIVLSGTAGNFGPGRTEQDLSWNEAAETFDVSDDGTKLLIGSGGIWSSDVNRRSLYLRDLNQPVPVKLGTGVLAKFLRGGQQIMVLSSPNDPVYSIVQVGYGHPQEVIKGLASHIIDAAPFPDGSRILGNTPEGWKIFDVATGIPHPFAGVNFMGYNGFKHIAPDGKWVALARTASHRLNVPLMLLPVEGGQGVDLKGLEPYDIPARWRGDGRAIYVFNRDGLPMQIHQIDIATGKRSWVKSIMPANPAGLAGIRSLALTPDARFVAYNYTRKLSDLYLIEGLK